MKYSQDNIKQFYQLIGSMPDQEFSRTDHFEFIKTKNSVWPNQLINFHPTKDDMDEVLHQIENRSFNGTFPSQLMLNPSTDSDFIINGLKKANYKSSQWTAMTHDLNRVKSGTICSDFKIRLIKNHSDLKLWLEIVKSELMGNQELNHNIFKNLVENQDCYLFLGFENKKPVATSLLFVNESNAGIYLVATIKTHRKKGYGKEMTQKCLLKAKELNCERADIQATKFGRNVYSSIGFVNHGDINVFRIEKNDLKPD